MVRKTMFATDKDYREMLRSRKWQRLRAWKISRHPCCEVCEAEGVAVPAVEVHHVRPVLSVNGRAAREALMFDPGNIVALCHKCHVEAHRQLGKWQVRRWDKKAAEERRRYELDMFAEKFGLKTGSYDGDRETGVT
ncbi:MAG: HNH endonuclease [Bacteroidales bacterium]|nr:HNH endonuclease [Bacteroidales bacterium]